MTDPTDLDPGDTAMNARTLQDTLSALATDAVPDSTDLWPAIGRRLAERDRPEPSRPRAGVPRTWLARGALATMVFVGILVAQQLLPGQLTAAQATDLARNDPQVQAILRGDIAIATVTSVVDDVATVVVRDSAGMTVTVAVDLRSRIVTSVYTGPQLSGVLTQVALDVIRADPRTGDLLARGATIGRISPITVTYEGIDPVTGDPTPGTETWAQVPLRIGDDEWSAYVDLPQAKIDQLIDPSGAQVPLP